MKTTPPCTSVCVCGEGGTLVDSFEGLRLHPEAEDFISRPNLIRVNVSRAPADVRDRRLDLLSETSEDQTWKQRQMGSVV